ncbi:MAG TPA: NAD(P)/FAD-dependent oxidoreductase [Puia sp.]|uniref:phytoene desaturase family protein n=1 Tax=Puia sp. TaxID=2045100 RepID=UPI002C0924B8|nr:NAD(P)/FAD-dependent oxidoreductase [Puia sp.]HVU98282.1 NAD(P)/FAD-dependent oxidoreductase [Puia sp.]
MSKTDFDAVILGSGPNGLAAAIVLQQRGLSTLIIEGRNAIGGGMRSAELTLPGFIHDVCSAAHPLGIASPFFKTLPLDRHGLEWIVPPIAAAHPLDTGTTPFLTQSPQQTAESFGVDRSTYLRLLSPLVKDWPSLAPELLGPFHFPNHPGMMARFGWQGIPSAAHLAKGFQTAEAKALVAGMAAHAMQPLTNLTTAAVTLIFLMAGHGDGWPIARYGSVKLAEALAAYYTSLGGRIQTNTWIGELSQLPSAKALLLDLTPRQLLKLGGNRWSALYQRQLERYRYGMGVFKVDWALDGPIPWKHPACREAGTVNLGNTFEEIAASEALTAQGGHPDRPFVLLTQPSLFDPSRAPQGKHTAWAYCHVPGGSRRDMTAAVEAQIERYAPGFRDRILARHTMDTAQMEEYNPNYVGGDINGGIMDIRQLFTRPALRRSPYRTSVNNIYLCSSASPPGGGVHGMCGYHAARRVLRDLFRL